MKKIKDDYKVYTMSGLKQKLITDEHLDRIIEVIENIDQEENVTNISDSVINLLKEMFPSYKGSWDYKFYSPNMMEYTFSFHKNKSKNSFVMVTVLSKY